MTIAQILAQVQIFARPTAQGTVIAGQQAANSPLSNQQVWLNEELRKFYRLHKWWFLGSRFQLNTVSGTQTYPTVLTSPANNLGLCLYGATRLQSTGDINEMLAFFSGSGSPRGVAIDLTDEKTIWVFPNPNGIFTISGTAYIPFGDLQNPSDHNYLTDNFADLVIACGVYITASQLQEPQLAGKWYETYSLWIALLREVDTEYKRSGNTLNPLLEAQRLLSTATFRNLMPQQPQQAQ